MNSSSATSKNETNGQNYLINTTAITGFRGFMAIYIMMFHSLISSKSEFNILGSILMPFFFLISGFVLGMNEGKQQYLPTKCCAELCSKTSNPPKNAHGLSQFDATHFYQRRIARTLPLFYLTNIMCIPLVYAGHAHVWTDGIIEYVAYILNLSATSTWFGVAFPLNNPSWYVSTVWFYYWTFPSLFPKLQRFSVDEKKKWIVIMFWIQFIGGILLVATTFIFAPSTMIGMNSSQWAFTIGTYWPPSRFPVFIMGVLAGLLRNEGLLTEIPRPWTSDRLAVFFLISFLVVITIENYEPSEQWTLTIADAEIQVFRISAVWMQLGIAWWALQFILSLTFEDGSDNRPRGTSRVSKILTSRVALECGRISYAVYLVHDPLIQYFCWMNYGAISRPKCEYGGDWECESGWNEFYDSRQMPMWNVPLLWIVSIVLAVLLNRLVEEPMRRLLRPTKVQTSQEQLVANKYVDMALCIHVTFMYLLMATCHHVVPYTR